MAPGVFFTVSAMAALRSAGSPIGHFGEGEIPIWARNLELVLERNSVKTKFEPLPAGRLITWIGRFGKLMSGLSFAICGAFQVLISPRKIPARTSPESLSSWWTSGIL